MGQPYWETLQKGHPEHVHSKVIPFSLMGFSKYHMFRIELEVYLGTIPCMKAQEKILNSLERKYKISPRNTPPPHFSNGSFEEHWKMAMKYYFRMNELFLKARFSMASKFLGVLCLFLWIIICFGYYIIANIRNKERGNYSKGFPGLDPSLQTHSCS